MVVVVVVVNKDFPNRINTLPHHHYHHYHYIRHTMGMGETLGKGEREIEI